MKKLSLVSFAVAAALSISPAVLLGQNENFTISIISNGIDFSGSGTFWAATAYSAVPGGGTATDGYLITSFSGSLISAPGAPPALGAVTLIPSTNPGGNFTIPGILADDLLFISNDVAGPGSGYLDNSGLVVALGGYEVNIFTGQSTSLGPAGLPYQVYFYPGGYSAATTINPTVSLSVPEFGSLSMLILCALALSGALFYKGRQSGLFLNS
jgi:hypothetical protein